MVGAQTLEPDLRSNLVPPPTSLGTVLCESGSHHGSELRLGKGLAQSGELLGSRLQDLAVGDEEVLSETPAVRRLWHAYRSGGVCVQLSRTGHVTAPSLLGFCKAQLCWGTGMGVGMGVGSWTPAPLL